MSHVHEGPLATYNSLTDPNLAGYFGNTRMRRHLKKSGLVSRRGEIISENQYRLNMARREHKKHVKDLLAQAIVHKTLDLERYRQVEIKKKLEEISKIELVRRVRATRGRKGDEEVLPYLSPRSHSRPQSGKPSESSSGHRRPKSAPAPPRNRHQTTKSGYTDPYDDVVYINEDGRPVSPPPPSDRHSYNSSLRDVRQENIDTRHLYALDSEALQQYALKLSKADKGRDGASSPYLISQIPQPPRHERARSAKSPRRSGRMSARPDSSRRQGVSNDSIERSQKDSSTVEGNLMLHRQEPAMMHQGEVQTLCEITMKYHGPNLTLPRDQFDPTQEVSIEQQHCGGNTLPVFKERLQAGSTFSFISRRHRGYPFSLTLYIDGRVDCRVSTCCEYKHGIGVKLGGKMGHFSLTGITGATPCYKCKLSVQAPPRSLKLKKGYRKKKTQQTDEVVTVEGTPRRAITPSTPKEEKSDDEETVRIERHEIDDSEDEEHVESARNVVVSVEDDETSKGGNSMKSNFRGDKFVPHKSNRVKSAGVNNRRKSKEEMDKNVENVTDDYKDKKTEESSLSDNVVDVKGAEQTNYDDTVYVNGTKERRTSGHSVGNHVEHDSCNQDTYNEIGEEIFSEYNDKTRADDIIEEEIGGDFISEKNEMKGGNKIQKQKSVSIEEDIAENSNHGNKSADIQRESDEQIVEEIDTAEKSESEIKTVSDNVYQNHRKESGQPNDNYDDDFEEEDSKDENYDDDFEDDNDEKNGDKNKTL